MPDVIRLSIIDLLRRMIAEHHFLSGEVIFELEPLEQVQQEDLHATVKAFFNRHGILTENRFDVHKITREEAVRSICYGLSTKLNYTSILKEFTKSDQHTAAFRFLELFDQPQCYTIEQRIWQKPLNLDDFWETGGALVMDKQHIGIFWTNDLYDMF